MKLRGLYAITDSQLLAGKFLAYVEAALDGGVTLLQYRDKSSDEARRLREAEKLYELCSRYKTQLIINDDAALAAASVGLVVYSVRRRWLLAELLVVRKERGVAQ